MKWTDGLNICHNVLKLLILTQEEVYPNLIYVTQGEPERPECEDVQLPREIPNPRCDPDFSEVGVTSGVGRY